MVKKVERNKNQNDTAVIGSGVVVGNSASVTLLAANTDRLYIAITTKNKDIWLKLQPAATDNDKKGIFIPKDTTYELSPDTIYTGEISAISLNSTALVYTTEF